MVASMLFAFYYLPLAVFPSRPWSSTVAVCVCVSWCCHPSGGNDVVDLPDIFLPAGQYVDLLDSESDNYRSINRVCLLAGHLAGHMEDSRTPAFSTNPVLLTGRRAVVTPVPKTADCEEDCVLQAIPGCA